MTKILEVESQLTATQMEKEQISSKYSQLLEEHEEAVQTNEELAEENKSLEAKLEEFILIHNSEMQSKEEEIRKITQ